MFGRSLSVSIYICKYSAAFQTAERSDFSILLIWFVQHWQDSLGKQSACHMASACTGGHKTRGD